jgi:hypothetical protein
MMTPLEARLTEENAALRAENKAQQIEIKLLREKVDLLIRRVFGKSSEQLDDGQLMLLLQGEPVPKRIGGDARHLSKRRGRKPTALILRNGRCP